MVGHPHNLSSFTSAEINSQSRQIEACEKWGIEHEWTRIDHIHDTQTGKSYEARAGIQRVLSLVDSGRVTDVICYSVDRTGREAMVIQSFFRDVYLRGGRITIITKGKTYKSFNEIKKDTLFDVAVAEWERSTIVDRMQEGKMYAFLELGSFIFAPPYGYNIRSKRVEHGNQKLKFNYLDINEYEAAKVRLILDKYIETRSIMQTVQLVNKEGIKTKRNGVFTAIQLKDMLLRVDMYAGRPREEVYQGVTRYTTSPAIITGVVADTVKELLAVTPKKVRGSDLEIQPFYRLITCACCGSHASGSAGWKRERKGTYGLTCASLRKQRNEVNFLGKVVDKGTACLSQIALNHFIRALKQFLVNVDIENIETQFEYEVSKQIAQLRRIQAAVSKGVARRDELKVKQSKLVDATIKLAGNDEFAVLVGAYSEALKEIQRELAQIDLDVKAGEADLATKFRVFESLDISLDELNKHVTQPVVTNLSLSDLSPEKLKAYGDRFKPEGSLIQELKQAEAVQLHAAFISKQAEGIKATLAKLSEDLEADNYDGVNRTMHKLGLRFMADFSDRQQNTRTASIRVMVDFEPIEKLLAPTGVSGCWTVSTKTGTY
ncbi:recombinase family protein [Deinococcus sp. QL22]|uniref:recombinase family protein n=1 Tax=Deinococcus sp. QL22 TaxID=2939437 RepID=UPI002017BA0D|nr:recombinase family protein [Deinococcus sp. QL22]UQN05352.1 recombinase family protein [Deinococcus sp. QL22]